MKNECNLVKDVTTQIEGMFTLSIYKVVKPVLTTLLTLNAFS